MSKTFLINQGELDGILVENNALLLTILGNQVEILDQLNPDKGRDKILSDINVSLKKHKSDIRKSLKSGKEVVEAPLNK